MKIFRTFASSLALVLGTFGSTASYADSFVSPVVKPASTDKFNIRFYPGDKITSRDGRFTLVYQADGNLVLYQGETAIWDTETYIGGNNGGKYGYDAGFLRFQDDGNLVIYHRYLQTPGADTAVWSSGTSRNRGYTLDLQDDGNLVIYGTDGRAKWSSRTCCR